MPSKSKGCLKMESITYSLTGNNANSDKYYQDVESFTDEVLKVSESYLQEIIPEFVIFRQKNNQNVKNPEICFELLMLGTLWNIYIKRALHLCPETQKILKRLANIRLEEESLKPYLDPLRGILLTLFLLPEKEEDETPELNIDNLDKLLKWLEATGEFTQELKPLRICKDFLSTLEDRTLHDYLKKIIEFALWFSKNSKSVLGVYTINVDKFLETQHSHHRWKEDVIFTGRKRTEYHLNMVGAAIMTRTRRNEFQKRPRKALLLPGCMRSRNNENCPARKTNLGLKCAGCRQNCRVKYLTDLGLRENFEVYIITHESSALKNSTPQDRDELGIVGVSCISNLISGGWKSDSMGIPAQCVLLDCCGCHNHWNQPEIPTNLNERQLMNVLSNNGFDRNILDEHQPLKKSLIPKNTC